MDKRLFLTVACAWAVACGDASKFAGLDGAVGRDAAVEIGVSGDTGTNVDLFIAHPATDGMPVSDSALVPGGDAARAIDVTLDAFDPLGGCSGNYVACGCGCCGPSPGSGAQLRCYYPGEGERLSSIMTDDLAARGAPSCSNVGCSLGILYQCCAPTATATPASYSVETYIGGYNRLTIHRVGEDGQCAKLVLWSPVDDPNPDFRVTTPTSFQVEYGDFGPCGATTRTMVVGGVGVVALKKKGTGCALDARFSLFLPTSSGPATSIRFEANGLEVRQVSSASCPD